MYQTTGVRYFLLIAFKIKDLTLAFRWLSESLKGGCRKKQKSLEPQSHGDTTFFQACPDYYTVSMSLTGFRYRKVPHSVRPEPSRRALREIVQVNLIEMVYYVWQTKSFLFSFCDNHGLDRPSIQDDLLLLSENNSLVSK